MSFPRFRRHYECLVPNDERPHGIVDEKAVSNVVTRFGKTIHTSSFKYLLNKEETVYNDSSSINPASVSIIPNRFYEYLKLKNLMCELCVFSQI